MNKKLFWWELIDITDNSSPLLWYIDNDGITGVNYNPMSDTSGIPWLLRNGYIGISWQSARTMGEPY